MYVRLVTDSAGRIFLEQLLTLSDHKMSQPKPSWEKVPMVGVKGMESYALPLGISCGLLFINEMQSHFDANKGMLEREVTTVVSALDVYVIQAHENHKTLIMNREKQKFILNMDKISFIETLMRLLSKFEVLQFDVKGNLITK